MNIHINHFSLGARNAFESAARLRKETGLGFWTGEWVRDISCHMVPLGNGPHGKDAFIEMIVKKPASTRNLLRPCMDPSTTTTTCKPGPPLSTTSKDYQEWFYKQYYSSYADLRQQYPWTALGYTFDWAPDENGESKFVKVGESEFVIPKGASIEIQSETRTAEYCTAQ